MDKQLETRLRNIELASQNAQPVLREIFVKCKQRNRAIKHLGVFGLRASLLAYAPDPESQNPKVLRAQYTAMSQFFGAHLESFRGMKVELETMAKANRAIAKDYGVPQFLRIQTVGGNAVGSIYVAPVDPDSLVFAIITTRAVLERDPYVVKEEFILEDLEKFAEEAYEAIEGELARIKPGGVL